VAETIRSGEVAPAPQRSPDRNHLAIIAGLALLAVVGAAGAFLLLREGTTMGPRTPPIEARPPIERLVPTRDAGAEPVQPPPVEDVAAVDAGAVVTGYTAEPADPAHHQVAPSRTGRLELRIRPYATVSIDGHEVGDTPLPPQTLTVGRHKVRLVNSGLQKDVVLEIVVKPGDNLLKHNLKE
jgi:serine/threonine-protein kinase